MLIGREREFERLRAALAGAAGGRGGVLLLSGEAAWRRMVELALDGLQR